MLVMVKVEIPLLFVKLAIIDEQGVPTEPEVIRSVHATLDDAALEAVMKQRFTPGKQRGRAVRVKISIPVRFSLITTG